MTEALSLLRRHRSYVLTTHVNPDGDGLGSELALAEWLSAQGKEVFILNCSPTPAVYLFLDPARHITVYDEAKHASVIAGADVIVVMDTNSPDRVREMKQPLMKSSAATLCIDHHLDPAPFADTYLIDADATSTGEIVCRLLQAAGGTLSPSIAAALYCAIMTDTGSFRYPRVDSEVHRMIGLLIDAGADPVSIYNQVYEQWSEGRIHLLGEMLAGMRTMSGGRLAYAIITQKMLHNTGTSDEDTDNFTTYPMSIAGVTAGILFVEKEQGVKISFRSKGDVPINRLAQEFGGNGHLNAAGARVFDRSLDSLVPAVLEAAIKYTQKEDS